MHGESAASTREKALLGGLHLGIVLGAGWLLLGGGAGVVLGAFGFRPPQAEAVRRGLLFAAGLVYWARMTFGLFVLLSRRVGGSEVAVVAPRLLVLHASFALLGVSNGEPAGPLFLLGIPLYLLGSWLNTASELQRRRWKGDPAHAGRLWSSPRS